MFGAANGHSLPFLFGNDRVLYQGTVDWPRARLERFRRMAHSAPVLIWMSGTEALQLLESGVAGFYPAHVSAGIGFGWAEGVHPEDLDLCVQSYENAFDARQPFEIEYRLRRHDGEYRWILDKGIPRHGSKKEFAGYIGSALDITDLKRAEETNRALSHVRRLAVVGELTAAIAHEVRQPLSVISLNAQTGEKLTGMPNPPMEEVREIVADIRRNVVRADAVISRIREFLGKRDAQMLPIDCNAVVRDVLWLLSGDAVRRGVRMRTEFGVDLPQALGDRTQLQQVLLNLAVNGMEAMEGVPVDKRRLVLRTAHVDDEMIEISVSDCGCGLQPEQLPKLFESFSTTRMDGMGLGLSMARSIVHAHRGRIWAENNSDAGAHFISPCRT